MYNNTPDLKPDASHEAEAFLSLLWRHIYERVQGMLHPHHWAHEPGGKDHIQQPLSDHSDLTITTLAAGHVIKRNADNSGWINGVSSGGGGMGQAFFQATGSEIAAGTIPGPTNLWGVPITISHVLVQSDGAVAGTVTAGGAFTFAAGGGSDDNTGLSYTWSAGAQLSMEIDTVGGDATYLTADVYFTAA